MRARTSIHAAVLLCLAFICCRPAAVKASEQDETLLILGQPIVADSVVGRLPRQLSRTAENTTVITTTEIEALNAHTLSDILATVPGIQLESLIGSANLVFTRIQGSNFGHVAVLLDGIPYNNLGDNFADIGMIPARIIERVEIVKGAASSAWGQALGGVINVITKTADAERRFGGMATAARGERNSSDSGGELSGASDRLGYYLSGGYLATDGLQPNTGFHSGYGHGRLAWQLPRQGQIGLLVNYAGYGRGDFAFAPFDVQSRDNSRRQLLGLSLSQPLAGTLELKLDTFYSDNRIDIDAATLSSNLILQSSRNNEQLTGGGARILWRLPDNLLIAGIDYQHARMHSSDTLISVDLLNRRADRWGFYLNDTYGLGPLAFTAGLRYDLTGTSGDQFSPSLGVTWQLTDSTLLRGYTARGFSLPAFSLERKSERVWTSQVGLESSAVPYLWLKGTLFRNETRDITTVDFATNTIGSERQTKQGVELEARSASRFNTSLRAGYCYVDAQRNSDDSTIKDIAKHTLHLGLLYDNHQSFKGLLTGRYIDWNAAQIRNGSFGALLWDLHLNSTPFSGAYQGVELFLSLRNIFNGSSYLDEIYRNNGRWLEGGMRWRF
jgi:vitamin B12 transporter